MKVKALILCTLLLICNSVFAQEAIKQDEFGAIGCDDYLARMDNVKLILRNDPTAKVHILIYEGKERINGNPELVFPAFGSAKARITSIKKHFLFMKQTDLLKRIVFVKAGFRETLTFEVWFTPFGATPPKPAPTLTKMRYRKGKPKGFCISM